MKFPILFVLFFAINTFAAGKEYSWSPSGSEYSCTFQNTPKIKEAETTINGNRIVSLTAEYLGDEGFQRAEFFSYDPTQRITKDFAVTHMTEYALSYGMAHFDITFDDSNLGDVTCKLRASKTINTKFGDIIMNFNIVSHWGKNTYFAQTIGESAKAYPSKQGQAFLDSIRQIGLATPAVRMDDKVWISPGGEYSVTFAGKPDVKKTEVVSTGGRIPCYEATYQSAKFTEQATIGEVSGGFKYSEEAVKNMLEQWAKDYGLKEIQISFSNKDPNDAIGNIKGQKTIRFDGDNLLLKVYYEMHFGRTTLLNITFCEPYSESPSDEFRAFLASIRHHN